MNYLVGGGYCKIEPDLMEDALDDISSDDQIMLVGYNTIDDMAASFAHKHNIKIVKEAPDNPLRGRDARMYAFKTLAKKADIAVIVYKLKNKEVLELIETAENEGLEVREYYVD